MRLINADALPVNFDGHTVSVWKKDLDNAPTIDPEELRPTAHWEDEYGGKYDNPRYRCSCCKEKALYKMERKVLGGWHEVQALTPSCHSCGAKMEQFDK